MSADSTALMAPQAHASPTTLKLCGTFTKIVVPATFLSAIISFANFFSAYILSLTGTDGVAASGLFTALQLLLQSFIYSFLYVLGPLTGNLKKDDPDFKNKSTALFAYGTIFSLILSTPMMAFYGFAEPFFVATGQNDTVAKIAGDAFRHYTWGCWADVALVAISQYAIARSEMISATIASLLQKTCALVLAYHLVLGANGSPKLGAEGLGFSYSISAIIALIAYTIYLAARKKISCINLRELRKQCGIFTQILKFGWPVSVHMGSELAVLAWLMQMTGVVSTQSLTATEIVCQYAGFAIAVIIGLSQGTSILISKVSKNREAVKTVIRIALISAAVLSLITGVFFMAIPAPMTDAFLGHTKNESNATITYDNEVKDIAAGVFLVMALSNIPDNFRNVHTGSLRGEMDTFAPMIANVVQSAACLGLAYLSLYATNMGALGIFLARGISIAGVCAYLWHRSETKQPTCAKALPQEQGDLPAVAPGSPLGRAATEGVPLPSPLDGTPPPSNAAYTSL
jgi:MATE family multidrug resistance protein